MKFLCLKKIGSTLSTSSEMSLIMIAFPSSFQQMMSEYIGFWDEYSKKKMQLSAIEGRLLLKFRMFS